MPFRASAQAAPGTKAAVVIGVDHACGLPILNAAASGAKDMAKWLRTEGYDVSLFADDDGPVAAGPIFGAVRAIIAQGTYARLLIYFAGHGCINQKTDFWLLSGAPENPNEAVNVDGSAWSARLCGVPNVVFVSDCCRSLASDLGLASVSGSNIFPNGNRLQRSAAYVDRFHATRIGDAAFEGSVADGAKDYHGIYTHCFLSAFDDPPADIVASMGSDRVVPDRELERYLEAEVPKRAQAMSLTLRQFPDAIVTSPDRAYLGRISGTPRSAAAATSAFTTKDLSSLAIGSASSHVSLDLGPEMRELGRSSGYFSTHDVVIGSAAAPGAFEGRTGFVASNATISRVAVTAGTATLSKARTAQGSTATSVLIETGGARDASALIEFEDGSATVAAVLTGYVGTLAVDRGGVVSLSYTPSPKGGREAYGAGTSERLDQLRANAAAAARLGAFRADTPQAAARLGEVIRLTKGIDPTLSLYAAYAYEQAGLLSQIESVAKAMREELGVLIFDVAMLGGSEPASTVGHGGTIAPFCPMLSQGWSYIGATGSVIPKEALEAARHLRQALWTTFDPDGVRILLASPLFAGGAR